jgi:RNA polymerase sigma-70 factor (ECF subfamily)
MALVQQAAEDDEELVRLAGQGDTRAFSLLYRRHARYVAGVAYRLMGDAAELDDVVQETFVAAFHGLAGLTTPSLLRRWLVTVALRQVARRLQARQRRRWLGQELERQSPVCSDPALQREVHELYAALEQLPPRYRLPWVLSRVEGEAIADVAALCGVSLATTKRRLAHADRALERRLKHG